MKWKDRKRKKYGWTVKKNTRQMIKAKTTEGNGS